MSVRQGYKQTDIGEIPEEWDVARLATVSDIVGGSTPSTSEPSYWNGDIPFVTPSDVTALNGKNMLSTTEKYITKKGLQSISAKLLPKGSILLTSRATIGVCAINDVEVVTNQGFANLVPKEGIDGLWLLYQLRLQRRELERLASGSTFKEVSKSSLRRMRIPLPPAPVQQKIASILSTVDETIQRTNEVIGKTEVLKGGLMQRLLTRGIGHTQFNQTELGEIPKGWEIVQIGDILKLTSGKTRPKEFSERRTAKKPYPIFGGNGIFGYSDAKLVDFKTIVIGRVGEYCGSVLRTPGPSWISDNALYTKKFLRDVEIDFLTYYLDNMRLNRYSRRSGQPLITQGAIYPIKIAIPSIQEQKRIAEILSAVDVKIEKERNKKTQLEDLKKGLMQVLLTGKIRVKVD